MGPYGNVALHVANCYGYNEVVQLFLTNRALKSLENISSQVVLYDESKMNELKTLFLIKSRSIRVNEWLKRK